MYRVCHNGLLTSRTPHTIIYSNLNDIDSTYFGTKVVGHTQESPFGITSVRHHPGSPSFHTRPLPPFPAPAARVHTPAVHVHINVARERGGCQAEPTFCSKLRRSLAHTQHACQVLKVRGLSRKAHSLYNHRIVTPFMRFQRYWR